MPDAATSAKRADELLELCSSVRCEQSPRAGDPIEDLFTTIDGLDARPDDEVHNGPRNEDFTWFRQRLDPGSDVHRHAADVVAANFHLTGMDAGSDL
jgi:hypothetical protein